MAGCDSIRTSYRQILVRESNKSSRCSGDFHVDRVRRSRTATIATTIEIDETTYTLAPYETVNNGRSVRCSPCRSSERPYLGIMQRLSNNGIGYEVGKSLDPDDCGETRMKWEKRKKRIEFAWKCLVIFKNHSKG